MWLIKCSAVLSCVMVMIIRMLHFLAHTTSIVSYLSLCLGSLEVDYVAFISIFKLESFARFCCITDTTNGLWFKIYCQYVFPVSFVYKLRNQCINTSRFLEVHYFCFSYFCLKRKRGNSRGPLEVGTFCATDCRGPSLHLFKDISHVYWIPID